MRVFLYNQIRSPTSNKLQFFMFLRISDFMLHVIKQKIQFSINRPNPKLISLKFLGYKNKI